MLCTSFRSFISANGLHVYVLFLTSVPLSLSCLHTIFTVFECSLLLNYAFRLNRRHLVLKLNMH